MGRFTIKVLAGVFTFILGVTAASTWIAHRLQSNEVSRPALEEPSATPKIEPARSPALNSPIRSVDFANFTYAYADDHRQRFTLHDGRKEETRNRERWIVEEGFSLTGVEYGDVTGDGQEEAFVRIGILTGGSAIPSYVYIYTLRNRRPKLLWSFATGDRADGGLRRISVEDGGLVVELYGKRADGKGKIIGSDLYADDGTLGGACCPTHFTRARYMWNGKRFVLKGEPEVLPNTEGHGQPSE